MKTLSKKRTVKRFAMLISCFTAITAGVFFTAKYFNSIETNAITKDGTPVNVSYVKEGTDTTAPYVGWVHFSDSTGWGTPMFNITLKDEDLARTAYCLDPNTTPPAESASGSYNYSTASFPINDQTNKIKLALYIITAPSTDTEALAIQNQWNWNNPSGINPNWNTNHITPNGADYAVRNYQYIMMHALIGSIYNPENAAEIWDSLAEQEQTWIENVTANLASLIKSGSAVWKRASSHQLLGLDSSDLSDVQNIAWLEPYSISTSAVDSEDGDQYIAASKEAKIMDTVNYCAQEGVTYTIQGTLMDKSTGKALSVGGKNITASTSVTPTAECGAVTLAFTFDASALAGTDIVAFQSLISSDGITLVSHEDLADPAQTVTVVSLDTDATGKSDKKEIVAAEGATITDHVKYCLAAGTEYTIIGTLMNKSTGEPIKVNDEPITQTATFTPTKNCGELDMKFEFDATGMGGTEIVVFETAAVKVTQVQGGNGSGAMVESYKEVISHEDLKDEAQTILVVDPAKAPETGLITASTDSSKSESNAATIIIVSIAAVVCGYAGIRLCSRKRFFGKK